MRFVAILASFAVLNLCAAISPGPDTAIVIQHVLDHGRRAAIYASLGIACALLIHMGYAAFGLVPFMKQHVFLLYLMGFSGCAYLFYLGFFLFFISNDQKKNALLFLDQSKNWFAYYRSGFLTNLLNPKAALFISSMFVGLAAYSISIIQKFILIISLSSVSFAWFATLSLALSHPFIQAHFVSREKQIKRFMGIVLMFFAFLVLWMIFNFA